MVWEPRPRETKEESRLEVLRVVAVQGARGIWETLTEEAEVTRGHRGALRLRGAKRGLCRECQKRGRGD